MTQLHILAVNAELDLRHTHLTRARGEVVDLPPLADWLGVEALDLREIELFPVKDLDDTSLSDYVSMAFDPREVEAGAKARMDALEGSVLIVPSKAMSSAPAPGAEVTMIATLPLSQPDHSADLPKVKTTPLPQEVPTDAMGRSRVGSIAVLVMLALLVLIAIVLIGVL